MLSKFSPKSARAFLQLVALFLCTATTVVAATTTLWVAPDGNDSSAGTEKAPFATIARAVSSIAPLAETSADNDIEIKLRAGTYALNTPVTLNSANLGKLKGALSIQAHNHEPVIITGSRRLQGKWSRSSGNLWVLDLPEAQHEQWVFRSLFRAGKSLPRGREPNTGFWTISNVSADRCQATLREKLPAEWAAIRGAELNSTAYWHFNRQPVAQITPDQITTVRPIGTDVSSARIHAEKSHSRLWLENALPFVDEPGEWYLDTTAGKLYYMASPGEDPNALVFTAPVLRELFIARGTPEKPLENLHIAGIEFAETDWEMPDGGRLGVQAGSWAFDRSRTYTTTAALRFIYALNTSVKHCRFHDLGDGAISYEIGCHHGVVARNEFTRVGSNVLQIGRMPEYTGENHPLHRDFIKPNEWVDAQDAFPGSDQLWNRTKNWIPEAPSVFEIADNTIIDCGQVDLGSVAILVGYANHVRIEHNLISGMPYTGISVGWRWAPGLTNCHSNLIAGNRIEKVMQLVGDGAGIYLVGAQPGTRVLNNFVTDVGRNYWSHGIYPDEYSEHMEISGNYVLRVMDYSIFMNRNGRIQNLHDNNGQSGKTVITGSNSAGAKWTDFSPENAPPASNQYGPRAQSADGRSD